MRRNTFSTCCSPKTIDELDCSAPIGRISPVGSRPPWKETPSTDVSAPSMAASTRSAPVVAGQQLVELVRAGLKARLDELEAELRRLAQRDRASTLTDATSRDLEANQRWPVDPLLERAVDLVGQGHRSSSSRRNQKNPRGASVRR